MNKSYVYPPSALLACKLIRFQWNTYGDPPNSDLLRRYGFVDVTELQPPLFGEGNPADIVEIPANLVVEAAAKHAKTKTQERVDWWLEEAEDEWVDPFCLH